MESPLTTAKLARRFGVEVWKVRRVFERGMVPEPGRLGLVRVFSESDVPPIEAAMIRAGYLEPKAASVT